jgi:predicted HD superfamily hydrolase involved in NAD metabolism
MHAILTQMMAGIDLRGDLPGRVRQFLGAKGYVRTVQHTRQVAHQSFQLAQKFKADPLQAETAGWLHDVSAVFLDGEKAQIARQLGLDLLPEEEKNPVLIHQKISTVMAREMFLVEDAGVLGAIGCHTTLRAGASLLDKVLFVADKLAWDQTGNPPYLVDMQAALKVSLDRAALVYLRSLFERQPAMMHPWALAALKELEATLQ